jgi:ribonuclease BN (tRNA processing enzyme)
MDALYPGMAEVSRRFAVHVTELQPGTPASLKPVTATGYEVVHASGAPALAVRVTYGDRIIAYTGDTEWTPTIIDAADGTDLLIAEAYSWDKPIRYHLNWVTLRERLSQLRTRRVAVTHMGPQMLERVGELPRGVLAAEDGLRIRLCEPRS